MESKSNRPGGGKPPTDQAGRKRAIALFLFKMITVSSLIGLGVFLLIMGGLHPAAVLKANVFMAIDSPQAFRLAWQSGFGAGLITFAIIWLKMR